MKVGIMSLKNYREWTESLGSDREWIIQAFQHDFSSKLTKLLAEIGSFVLTYRFDSYIFLLDGVEINQLAERFEKIKEWSPVPISICYGYGKTFLEAERNCNLSEDEIRKYDDEKVVVAHFDLDGFTRKKLLFDAYLEVVELYNELTRKSMEIGAFTYYFGGDNIGIFLDANNIDKIKKLATLRKDLKVGIGIGKNARIALMNASLALHMLRINRNKKMEIVEVEN